MRSSGRRDRFSADSSTLSTRPRRQAATGEVGRLPASSSFPRRASRWETVCDLRVDDHPDPLGELRRLLDLHEGYTALGEVDDSAAVARRTGMPELDVHFAELFDAARAGDLERGR